MLLPVNDELSVFILTNLTKYVNTINYSLSCMSYVRSRANLLVVSNCNFLKILNFICQILKIKYQFAKINNLKNLKNINIYMDLHL